MSESKENVNHPSHYRPGVYEVINIIEYYELGFHLGNVVKYVLRAPNKVPDPKVELQDYKKARWYLDRKIGRMEGSILGPDAYTGEATATFQTSLSPNTVTFSGNVHIKGNLTVGDDLFTVKQNVPDLSTVPIIPRNVARSLYPSWKEMFGDPVRQQMLEHPQEDAFVVDNDGA